MAIDRASQAGDEDSISFARSIIMKVIKKIHFIFFLFSIWFSGCAIFIPGYKEYSTAKNYFNFGNYDQTVFYSSKSLQKKPANDKALVLLELAYPMALSQHESSVNILRAKTSKSKWPELVNEYEALNALANEIRKLKPILKINIDISSIYLFKTIRII